MPALVAPTLAVAASYREAMAEFRAEGRLGPDDQSELADIETRTAGQGFEAVVALLRRRAVDGAGFAVPSTSLWWVEGTRFLGRVGIRHRLSRALRQHGDNIGYDVRPSARRQRHATAMLAAALPVAAGLGVDPALVVCDEDNVASRRVIESAGGVLDSADSGLRRYWLATSGRRAGPP